MKKKIALSGDHAGFARKQAVIKYFIEKGIMYDDLGCYSEESCDYPDFAHKIACGISEGIYDTGFTFCGTGNGISMTANRFPRIRSAICWNADIARLARQHNDANICSIPGRFVSDQTAVEIVEVFLDTAFEGGRHQRRIDKINAVRDCK